MSENIESIDARFRELIAEGDEHVKNYFASGKMMDTRLAHGWTTASLNLIHLVTRGRGPYYEQALRTVEEAGGLDPNGKPLKDSNDKFSTTGGNAAIHGDFTPTYQGSAYTDFQLFMPYDELHISRGKFDLKFVVKFSCEGDEEAESEDYEFEYTRPK